MCSRMVSPQRLPEAGVPQTGFSSSCGHQCWDPGHPLSQWQGVLHHHVHVLQCHVAGEQDCHQERDRARVLVPRVSGVLGLSLDPKHLHLQLEELQQCKSSQQISRWVKTEDLQSLRKSPSISYIIPPGVWIINGKDVFYNQFAQVTFLCPMRFERYPLDEHICKFRVGSTNMDINYMRFGDTTLSFDKTGMNTILDYKVDATQLREEDRILLYQGQNYSVTGPGDLFIIFQLKLWKLLTNLWSFCGKFTITSSQLGIRWEFVEYFLN